VATVTKFADANTTITTGWTSPTAAYADDASYATAAPAKNSSVVTDYGVAAFTSGDIPDNSIINSVTIEAQYKSSVTNSTGATFGLRLNDNGSLHTETTFGMSTTDQTGTRANSSAVTLANLRIANTVKARVTGLRGNSNNAITWSVDYVKITVDYTAPVNGTATPAGVSTTSSLGTAAGSGGGTDAPDGQSGTTTLGTSTATGDASTAPAGVQTTSALGTAVADGGPVDGTATPAGVATTATLGTSTATGTATTAPAGVATTSALGTAVASGDEAPPEPEPPAPESSGAGWRLQDRPYRYDARAYPRGVSATFHLGLGRATGTAAARVTGVSFAVRKIRHPQSAIGNALVRARPLPAMRLTFTVPRPSVSVTARPRRPLLPIRLTDEELTALVLLIE
jgi:hypothetical protein